MKLPNHLLLKNFSKYPIGVQLTSMIGNYFSRYLKLTHLAIKVLGAKASSVHEVEEE